MIELKDVSKRYGSNQVLKQVNLNIDEGEFVCIRGKSGVGKSTLLKIIGSLDMPDTGKVKLFGKEVQKMTDAQRSALRLTQIGFVFQFFNLIPSLTVTENIELPLALSRQSKIRRRERALELMKYFDLLHLANSFPDSLSGGERQRIAFMRAVANSPRVVIADEPTSSIDDENAAILMDLLIGINRREKVTVVLSSTDLSEKVVGATEYVLTQGRLISG